MLLVAFVVVVVVLSLSLTKCERESEQYSKKKFPKKISFFLGVLLESLCFLDSFSQQKKSQKFSIIFEKNAQKMAKKSHFESFSVTKNSKNEKSEKKKLEARPKEREKEKAAMLPLLFSLYYISPLLFYPAPPSFCSLLSLFLKEREKRAESSQKKNQKEWRDLSFLVFLASSSFFLKKKKE